MIMNMRLLIKMAFAFAFGIDGMTRADQDIIRTILPSNWDGFHLFIRVNVSDPGSAIEDKLNAMSCLFGSLYNTTVSSHRSNVFVEVREKADQWMVSFPLNHEEDIGAGIHAINDTIRGKRWSVGKTLFADGAPKLSYYITELDDPNRSAPLSFDDVDRAERLFLKRDAGLPITTIIFDQIMPGWGRSAVARHAQASGPSRSEFCAMSNAFLASAMMPLVLFNLPGCSVTEISTACHYAPGERCIETVTHEYTIGEMGHPKFCYIRSDRESVCPKTKCDASCDQANATFGYWGPCSVKCGGGYQYRRFRAIGGGRESLYEHCPSKWIECNTHWCQEIITGTILLVVSILMLVAIVLVMTWCLLQVKRREEELARQPSGYSTPISKLDQSEVSSASEIVPVPRKRKGIVPTSSSITGGSSLAPPRPAILSKAAPAAVKFSVVKTTTSKAASITPKRFSKVAR